MRTIGNILWFLLAGLWLAIGYVASGIGNVLWVVLFGWELALMHAVTGLLLCITIIGIPLGIASWKMVPLALLPLGREVVPVGES